MSAFTDDLVHIKRATSTASNKLHYFPRKQFPLIWKQHTCFPLEATTYNQAQPGYRRGYSSGWYNASQITVALFSCFPYYRKCWMEVTDVVALWKNTALSSWFTNIKSRKKSILDRKYFPVLLCDIIVQLLKRYKVKLL